MSADGFNERSLRFVRSRWRVYVLTGIAILSVAGAGYLVVASGTGRAESSAEPGIAESAAEAEREAAESSKTVKLTPAQREAAGIVVEPVAIKPHAEMFPAPGEVHVNEYATSNVSPRIRATIISRHARLGDRVSSGKALVTLYSPEMAEAESAFVLASRNFDRMDKLKGYISGQQFDEAEVKRDETRGRLETYGLSTAQIAELAASGLASRPAGQFDLTAPQYGVITTDAFRLGEVVEPGKTLFEISNLSTVWIEAQVSADIAARIAGDRARVTAGAKSYEAKIIQTLQQFNEATRTVGIRLQVENQAGALKAGQYVNVELFGQPVSEISVPTAAVLRDEEGNWLVYVENEEGVFEPVQVQPLQVTAEETGISGISAGTKVVTRGAFFVKSEADKSSFGDVD